MKNILYLGPSWARRSFNTPNGDEVDYTSLYKELNLQDYNVTNIAAPGDGNQHFIDQVKTRYQQVDAIIWVYCEPIIDITDRSNWLLSEDCYSLRQDKNKQLLSQISNLNVPIALIGAHSDIEDCNHPNIEVIHPSWQRFLADYADVKLDKGWGCEIAHRWLMMDYPKLKPSKNLVNYVSDTWRAWCELDMSGVFCWCHPNRFGNELFANEIRQNMLTWLRNV
jgi:hypothetical protein